MPLSKHNKYCERKVVCFSLCALLSLKMQTFSSLKREKRSSAYFSQLAETPTPTEKRQVQKQTVISLTGTFRLLCVSVILYIILHMHIHVRLHGYSPKNATKVVNSSLKNARYEFKLFYL